MKKSAIIISVIAGVVITGGVAWAVIDASNEASENYSEDAEERAKDLHDRAQTEADALIARPEAQRQEAEKKVREFLNDDSVTVEYDRTTKSTYDNNRIAEVYFAGKDQIEIYIDTNEVVQFGPRPLGQGVAPDDYLTSPVKTTEELRLIAEEFINKNSSADISRDDLEFKIGEKLDIVFFRWTDSAKQLQNGMMAFAQVGISIGGEVVSYTNTL